MKKYLSLILVFSIVSGLFAGCASVSNINNDKVDDINIPTNNNQEINNIIPDNLPTSGMRPSLPTINDAETGVTFVSHVVYANWTENSKIYTQALNANSIETGASNIPIYKFNTQNEMLSFKEEFEGILSFDRDYGGCTFSSLAKKYDDTFFATNSIVLLYVTASSGSSRFDLSEVQINENKFHAVIRVTAPEIGTCDMAGWFIMIEVPNELLENCTLFSAEIKSSFKNER